jgi:hypothetical protein
MISLCHLSEECISWFPLRMIKVGLARHGEVEEQEHDATTAAGKEGWE